MIPYKGYFYDDFDLDLAIKQKGTCHNLFSLGCFHCPLDEYNLNKSFPEIKSYLSVMFPRFTVGEISGCTRDVVYEKAKKIKKLLMLEFLNLGEENDNR
jgi:hypothetical protein